MPGGEGENGGEDWIRGDHGQILANHPTNIRRAVELLEVTLRQNDFALRTEVSGLPEYQDGKEINDQSAGRLRFSIQEQFGFLPAKEGFLDVILDIACAHRYHPVREYLDEQQPKWDGVPRIDTLFITYGGAEDTPLNRAFGRIWLIAAVRRIRQPGCKFDQIPVVESPQGENKSSAMAVMAVKEEWFCDDVPIGVESKKIIEQTGGKWIVEFPDLTGMGRRDQREIKSFAARRTDRSRLSYGHFPIDVPRSWLGIATSNDDAYLGDNENRRWWPIAVKHFDLEMLTADRDQLWAEAAHYEAMGESIVLPKELWGEAAKAQEKRRVSNPVLDYLAPILGDKKDGPKGWVPLNLVWVWLIGPQGNQTEKLRLSIHLGNAMKDLGFKLKQEGARNNIHGRLRGERFYERGDTEAECAQKIVPSEYHDGMQGGVGNGATDGRREAAQEARREAGPWPRGSTFDDLDPKKH
jgi:hypothetical protein